MIDVKKIKDFFEAILTFSFILYILGFVIVNSYFALYGISIENLAHVKYLSASLIFLFTFNVFLYGMRIISKDGGTNKTIIDLKNYRIGLIVVYCIWAQLLGIHAFKSYFFYRVIDTLWLILGIMSLLIIPDFIYARIKDKSKILIVILPLLLFSLIFLVPEFTWFVLVNFLTVRAIVMFVNKIKCEKLSADKLFNTVLNGISVGLLIILNAIAFGGIVYPLIPVNFGGGKPAIANLLIEDKAQKNIEELGIKMGANGWTNNLKIIYKDHSSIYIESIRPERFSCIEIKGDIVKGVRFIGEYRMTFWEMGKKALQVEKMAPVKPS